MLQSGILIAQRANESDIPRRRDIHGDMHISRVNDTAAKRGPDEYFTGTVWLEEIARTPYVSDVRIFRVTFEPGARTAWHTHPHGQVLHILSGVGRVCRAGKKPVEVHPGDVISFEAGERHWHGAAPGSMMVHLAVQRADASGSTATWLEHVGDPQYAD